MKKSTHTRINKMTSDGLLVLTAKTQKDSSIVKLYVTDLTTTARVLIDIEKEVMLFGSVAMSEHDIKMICKELKNEQLSFIDKVKNAIMFD